MNLKRKFKMKKTAIALTVAALVATSAQAAPQANTFYAGAKAGWASFHDGFNQFKQYNQEAEYSGVKAKGTVKLDKSDLTYGVYGGYQITNHFAVELGYENFGSAKGSFTLDINGGHFDESNGGNPVVDAKKKSTTIVSAKMINHGPVLSLKASYPIFDNLDVYARVGAALVRSTYKFTQSYTETNGTDVKVSPADVQKKSSTKVSPVFAGGIEYAFTPNLAARLEYQWIKGVGKLKDTAGARIDFTPSIGAVTAGISYRFGQTPMMVPEVVNKEFKLKSDVLFAYNKADLKAEAKAALDSIYAEIAPLKSVSVDVAGYTDYLGSGNYNLALSQRRADTVANYLASKGVVAEAITATGYGEANPVKAPQCESVKGRKALIACLAEDRRVEISVKGTK